MGDHEDRQRKLHQLEAASERYVAFCGVISLAAFLLLGWPALIAWGGLAWGMQQFCQAMRGTTPKQPSHKPRQTKRPKRRCCD